MAKGLGDMFGWKGNGLYDWFDENRDTIGDFASGALGQGSTQKALQGGVENVDKLAPYRKEQAERNQQIAQATEQKNKTLAYLQQTHPDLAQAVEGGLPIGDAYNEAFKRRAGQGQGATADWSRLNDGTLYNQRTGETQAVGGVGGASTTEYGLTPIWGQFDDGSYGYGVQGKDGSFKQVDTGTLKPLDPRSLAGERASGTLFGKDTTQAALDLPQTIDRGEQALALIDQLMPTITDPATGKEVPNQGFEEQFATGPFGIPYGQTLGAIPNTKKAEYQANLDQVKAQGFLQGIQQMAGTGAISEAEGSKATDAVINARTSTTKEGFVRNMQIAQDIIRAGVARARAKAAQSQYSIPYGQTAPPPGGGAGPTDYKSKYGLN